MNTNVLELVAVFLNVLENVISRLLMLCISFNFWPCQMLMFLKHFIIYYSNYFRNNVNEKWCTCSRQIRLLEILLKSAVYPPKIVFNFTFNFLYEPCNQ